MKVGLLGLQGAFRDHIPHLRNCGVDFEVVRDGESLAAVDRLIIPGGESTVMAKFLRQFNMLEPLRQRVVQGMPVWGICAGAILLAQTVDGIAGALGALDISLTRNAYGRQIASDQESIAIPLFDIPSYPAVFIRAPKINSTGPKVVIHSYRDDDPVFIQSGRVMATTFHPELNEGNPFHRYFLSL